MKIQVPDQLIRPGSPTTSLSITTSYIIPTTIPTPTPNNPPVAIALPAPPADDLVVPTVLLALSR